MPRRSSSKSTSERASALNAAAATFSPTQLSVVQPVGIDMPDASSDGADFVPAEYVKEGEDILTVDGLAADAETYVPFSGFQLRREEIEWEAFQIQKAKLELHSTHRLEVEKVTLGLSLEIERLKQELNAIRNSNNGNGNGNGNGNENRNAVGGGNGEPLAYAEKENQGDIDNDEEAEKPDGEAVVGKKIIAFLRLTKDVPYPHRLYGKNNYSSWRESILSIAETTGCSHIIDDGQKCSPFTDENTYLWDQQNDWLYDLIWNSLSSRAMESVTHPKRRSAYLLWNQLESTFRQPLEEERRSIFHSLYLSHQTSDREYIKQFQEARRKLEKLGFPVPDWLLYDILYESVSSTSQNIIRTNFILKQEETPKSVPQTLDIDILIDELVACLPQEGNVVIISTISSDDSNTDLSSTTSPVTPSTTITGRIRSTFTNNASSDGDNTHSLTAGSHSKKKNGNNGQPSSNTNYTNSMETTSNDSSGSKDERHPTHIQSRPDPTAKCTFCARSGHVASVCFLKHPELAPERWRRQNQQAIEFRQKEVRGRQLRNRPSAGHSQQDQSKNRGRDHNNNTNNNKKNSKPVSASPSRSNNDVSQGMKAIASQFYEEMDNEV
ncbi:hypothetical protein HCBG_03381 [Histoplasma capsulatum G186AR]|uniref:Uncharacterized protein n=2 Tax=Ajellomyces capsulatus TaxID=5037 RepID=C0NJQ1_AJECG|nr:uncharacterized protein HCBG_03381 [Histoplasma capsulatum G186AR]EEH08092.1 hypothetical protein HCBG_03381 [Histoplasma capsulatum G186AR]KAG5299583.1 hypothetical protein I7I52_09949 [Histoplasma capsulatum]QSS67791.1 hypothetical protein I7I50_06977 [Histoplasma capsulatum G186AR]